jgi:hypothetical protein
MKKINSLPSFFHLILKNGFVYFLLPSLLFFSACQKGHIFNYGEPGKGGYISTSNDGHSVATDWYKLQLRMILQSSPAKSNLATIRLFSYSGVSLFEAARFEIYNSQSLSSQLNEMPDITPPQNGKKYSWILAANEALANITRDLFPTPTAANTASIDSLEKIYIDQVTASESADVVARSEAFGDSVASSIFNWSKTDLFNHASDPYTPPIFDGAWIPTPPAFAAAAGPYFGNCRNFMSSFSTMTAPMPPFAYSEDPSSDFYKMVNNDYTISKTLTTDQKNIALFWNDVGANVGYTPMGHCISILNQALDKTNAPLAAAVVAYSRAGIAMWDASIVCWRSKFKYNQLRPVSYIRKVIDTAWLPFLVTPPHPEYPAAHAFITSSVMETLTSVFGPGYNFTDHTYDFLSYPSRNYSSFDDAALECGQSRVYGGIHYQPSVDVGHEFGSMIGKAATKIDLTK